MTRIDESLFLQRVPVSILVSIRRSRQESYASTLSTEVDTTYAHTVKTLSRLEDEGYIKTEKRGRKKIIELTEEGTEVADLFGEVVDGIGEQESSPLLA